MIEPESVFGKIKNNRGFRRFLFRGLPKVSLEVGWLSLAHNFAQEGGNRPKSKNGGAGIASLAPPFFHFRRFIHQMSYTSTNALTFETAPCRLELIIFRFFYFTQ
nr:transposase [Paenibacillus agaridevorans]